ncbi:MAG: TatD family hydrolase [Candidatus Aenigmatarchaeota archaeon]
MIDTHCHLLYKGLKERNEEVIQEAKKLMKAIINCGYPGDATESLELLKKHPKFIYLSLGLHPIDIVKMSDEDIENYIKFVRDKRKEIVAIGEIGLDRHWYPEESQQPRLRDVFERMLDLSKEMKLPAILHTRKAEEECFKIVVEKGLKDVVFHCYAGSLTLAKEIIDQGFYISIGTNLLGSKNTKKIAKFYPLEQLLTETDSPFLSPYPGQINVPQNVKFVLEEMSKLRGQPVEEIDRVIEENCKKLFRI